jgi:hypothetical protein
MAHGCALLQTPRNGALRECVGRNWHRGSAVELDEAPHLGPRCALQQGRDAPHCSQFFRTTNHEKLRVAG